MLDNAKKPLNGHSRPDLDEGYLLRVIRQIPERKTLVIKLKGKIFSDELAEREIALTYGQMERISPGITKGVINVNRDYGYKKAILEDIYREAKNMGNRPKSRNLSDIN